MRLAGKRIVVTGSSMGIGQAVACKLAAEGAKLVVNARGMAALEQTLATIKASGADAVASCGSVADYDYCGQLIQTCVDQFGGIDVLINCAGIVEPQGSSILDISPDDWNNLINVHLTGTFNTCRHAAPIMAKQRSGCIINTSSHAFLGLYGGTGYAAGKGGTNSLTMAMAADLKEHGVSVNTVCPGAKMRMSSGDDYEQLIKNLNKRGLLSDDLMSNSLNPGSPDYVAALYAYLASDAARDISGRLFWGAGGYIGMFHKNPDELLAMKNHETSPPWRWDELDKIFGASSLHQQEKLYNLVLKTDALKVSVKQELLLKLANSKAVKALQGYFEKRHQLKQLHQTK